MSLIQSGRKDWYLGLDIGTDSVGWAATDTEYNILKFRGNATWGIYLFDAAKTAAERRSNRTARRRLQRKKQRIIYLQELMASDIAKVDELFFQRIKESALWADDRTTGTNHLFVGDMSDKEYNQKYPTIHHLICDLMENPDYHDPRLVYMACSYILAHRGHFLIDVSVDNIAQVTDFDSIYNDFMSWFISFDMEMPWKCESTQFGDIMKKKLTIGEKEREFYTLLFNGKKPVVSEGDKLSIKAIISLLCGRKIKLSELFCNDDYKNIEDESLAIASADYEDKIELLSANISDEEYDLLVLAKRIYDWSVLVDILQGEQFISKAKVKTYETHMSDLKDLKYIVSKYIPEKYDDIFRKIGKEANYASYSYNSKNLGKNIVLPSDYKMCSQEDFCKFVWTNIGNIEADINSDDADIYDSLREKINKLTLCPKQMTSNNRVIPYQLYYAELKQILNNASAYTPCLLIADEYGTAAEKIQTLMRFRIPYYVGPLNSTSKFAWVSRKADGKITPWNFDDKIDKNQSELNFIRRMTGKCSYLHGEDVLPKNSLLYSKFVLLNEINNIRVGDVDISVEAKQKIYDELFKSRRKVTVKMIKDFLVANNYCNPTDEISGVDITIKSELKAYHDFKKYIKSGVLSERDIEEIINRITLTTDKSRLRAWLKNRFNLSEDDVKKISKFKYNDFGRVSKRLLTEVYDLDETTGEIRSEDNIISSMWNTNNNFMELLSSKYGYAKNIDLINAEYDSDNSVSLDQRLSDMYISNSVKRPILRTLEITKELNKVFGCPPKKIFIEMARGADDSQRNTRTKSRRDQIKDLYSNYDKNEVAQLLSELESKTDDQLRSERLFLYFTQLGRCMYSGKPINIEELATKMYDVDHIWPQSKIKDDSVDNKVLVLSELNGLKGDKYPIAEEWRTKMYLFWNSLHDRKLISDKKYERLKRNTTFTEEELAGFINRQLVETRQSTKAIAVLLKEMMADTEIVYVKAGLVSNFRQEYKDDYFTLKCREVNDLHHAKDAYLNIVMGNVYNTLFTKNPIDIIKKGIKYSLNINAILNHDIERNGVIAWKAENDLWFNRVINTIHKNNIRFVRYSYCQKGALFDLMPLRKGNGQVELKSGMDINKYGGYNKQTYTGFYLVKHDDKKDRAISLVAIPLRIQNTISSIEDIIKYCISEGYKNPEVLLNGRLIKTNSLWEIDGYRVHLSGKSAGTVWFKCGQQLILSCELESYVKKIQKYCEKNSGKDLDLINQYDQIDTEQNIILYDVLGDKLSNTKYNVLMGKVSELINSKRDEFINLTVEQQAVFLKNMLNLFSCNDSQGKDLSLIGGVKAAGIQTLGLKMNPKRFQSISILDQSPTGLFESKTPNLLSL